MTVRSIVQMFESLASSTGVDASSQSPESPGRGNVCGLVTYYDGLAVVEEPPRLVATKTVHLERNQPVAKTLEPQLKEIQEKIDNQPSNQEVNEAPVTNRASTSKLARNFSLQISKIPQPKSREFHLAACSVRKPGLESRVVHLSACSVRKSVVEGASRSRTSSIDTNQPLYVPPPTPVSIRVRTSGTSYAAFVARIESSHSRLLDFEKGERWLGQVENMKGRVEALKRRNQLALANEVANINSPRKIRSMSECSVVSTASTASLSSTDTPEVNYQQL